MAIHQPDKSYMHRTHADRKKHTKVFRDVQTCAALKLHALRGFQQGRPICPYVYTMHQNKGQGQVAEFCSDYY